MGVMMTMFLAMIMDSGVRSIHLHHENNCREREKEAGGGESEKIFVDFSDFFFFLLFLAFEFRRRRLWW